jgi:hypothetical protein
MSTLRIETAVEKDGELHLTQLPLRKGDKVHATIVIRDGPDGSDLPADLRAEFDAWSLGSAEALAFVEQLVEEGFSRINKTG